MKKLLAILLSVLMLCTMIPFATVSASDEPTVVISIVDDLEEVNAGDEFQVEVHLMNNPGVTGANVKLGWDEDVFELVTYYDEDEEDDFNMIEVASKWNASSNKYITFGPLGTCLVMYLRSDAKKSQMRTEELFYTATLRVKDDAVSGTYDLYSADIEGNAFICNAFDASGAAIPGKIDIVSFGKQSATITVNGTDPEPDVPECEHEYEYDCSKVCSKCGEETRPEAEHQYFYACDQHCMICGELTNPEAAHSMSYVEAKPATCTENGNIAYWTCSACGGCWDNENATGMPLNRMMVIIPAAHTYDNDCDPDCNVCFENREELNHNVIHVEAVPATCTTEGNIEYWYCDVCGMAWLDAECTLNTNLLSVKLPASCSYGAEYHEAKAATCYEPGNTEYWYCANCDVYYADAACAIVTNAKNVIIPITHNVIHVEAQDPTCTEIGNIEYWYCDICGQAWLDEYCHLNTNLQAVKLGSSCKYGAEYHEAKAATCTENGNAEYWYCANCDVYYADADCTVVTNAKNLVIAASCKYNAEYTAAKAATCYEPGNTEYWYCANCDVYYADADCTVVTNAKNVIIPITHNVIHVEAQDPTCTEIGNIEYWYCDICGQAWLDELCHLNTNLQAVKLGASCKYGAEYHEAKAATCYEPGNTEYWYCANCDVYYADADCTVVTNAKNVIIPISHNIIHVEAEAATCVANGNIEYWYCADCGQAWLDEYCHLNTNLRAVVLPATGEHTYDGEYDVDCNVCGETREVSSPINCIGKSVSEDCSGLAFLFEADVIMAQPETNIAVYAGSKIVINGVEYGLKSMGAQVWVDGGVAKKVAAKNLYNWEENAVKFAVRVKDIPESNLDTIIYAQDYYVLDNGVTIYGAIVSGSYNGVMNAQ